MSIRLGDHIHLNQSLTTPIPDPFSLAVRDTFPANLITFI